MRRPPVAIGAEDGRVQVERLPTVRWAATSQAGWAAAAVRGAQQAALSPMLKRREQMPLTEGRSSGGMREKPSRLYGAKTCSSSSMSAGSPSTVASSDASSPAPCDHAGVWLSPLTTLPRARARARRCGGARSIRARAGAVAGAKVYAVKMEPGAEASTCAYASCYAWLQRAVSSETMYKLAALTTGAQHT